MISISRFQGYSPDTPLRTIYGPGVCVANVDEALLTPAGPFDDAAVQAFINSGEVLGATDDGLELTYEPEYQDDEYAGVPGNVRGGKRFINCEISVSGSFVEVYTANMQKFIPTLDATPWQTTEATPTPIGDILEPRPYILDSDYMNNVAIIGERSDSGAGMISIIFNAMNSEGFTLSLAGDEARSATDINLMASYGAQAFDTATGRFALPLRMYLETPAVAV